jgi:hypothetical protein
MFATNVKRRQFHNLKKGLKFENLEKKLSFFGLIQSMMEDDESWLYGDSSQTGETPKETEAAESTSQNPPEVRTFSLYRSNLRYINKNNTF